MDYEKKYKDALERAKKLYKDAIDMGENIRAKQCEIIFPELKEESEDEKIRKELISHFVGLRDNISKEWYGIKVDDIIAWLEKQGESKFEQCLQEGDNIITNKDGTHFNVSQLERVAKKEPKFKVGDYLVNDYCKGKVIALTDDAYLLDTEQGIPFSCEHNVHLWTIQDAEDGDVLCDGTTIFIFKDLLSDGSVMSYCDYDTDSGESNAFCPLSMNLVCSKITPATKEQYDLLLQKMKERGYTFDFEKKELKKIEIITPLFNVGDTIIKKHNSDINDFGQFTITDITGGKYWYNDRIICDITEQDEWEFYESVRQNPVWSEEDDRNLSIAIQYVFQHGYLSTVDWLKSLKDRVRPQWKPSEEQMDALRWWAEYGESKHIKTLYEELKKLKS